MGNFLDKLYTINDVQPIYDWDEISYIPQISNEPEYNTLCNRQKRNANIRCIEYNLLQDHGLIILNKNYI